VCFSVRHEAPSLLPVGSVEVIDRCDLGQPAIETRHVDGGCLARQGLRIVRDGGVIRRAGLAEQSFHVAIAQAVHEIPTAQGPLAATCHDLLQQPAKVFDRLIVVREDPHRVLDRHRADALQPAPHFHPEVVGLRRNLVE